MTEKDSYLNSKAAAFLVARILEESRKYTKSNLNKNSILLIYSNIKNLRSKNPGFTLGDLIGVLVHYGMINISNLNIPNNSIAQSHILRGIKYCKKYHNTISYIENELSMSL